MSTSLNIFVVFRLHSLFYYRYRCFQNDIIRNDDEFFMINLIIKGVMKMNDCIFCQILAGNIPSHKIYEDEHVLAFLDISQATTGHTLVIPKQHVRDLFELEETLAGHTFAIATKLAQKIVPLVGATGVNIVNNNHAVAGQAVFHFHVHIVPRFDAQTDGYHATWKNNMATTSNEVLADLAARLRD